MKEAESVCVSFPHYHVEGGIRLQQKPDSTRRISGRILGMQNARDHLITKHVRIVKNGHKTRRVAAIHLFMLPGIF
jgi:hypothetical protein